MKKKCFFIICFLISTCIFPVSALRGAWGVAGAPCAEPKENVEDYSSYGRGCAWAITNNDTESAKALWGTGQVFAPNNEAYFPPEEGQVYAPFTGMYHVKMYTCPSVTTDMCTIAKSTQNAQTINAVKIKANLQLSAATESFGGYNFTLATSSNVCYTLLDEDGMNWRADLEFMCEDAELLPEEPSMCYLNHNTSLDVNMGNLERGEIATIPEHGNPHNIKKEIPVLCTRDSGVTVATTFKFDSINVNGNQVVTTSSPNLGVAIFYEGKLMGPSTEPVIESFESGYAYRELEFQAVRDSNVAIKEIPTGKFTANAVMVMTEQ